MDTISNSPKARPNRALAYTVLICLCVVYFFSYLQRVAVPGTIFDELQSAFRASASAITALSVIYFYVYGGLQLIVGTITDRAGVLAVLVAGGLILAAGAFLFPTAHSLPGLYFARILLAIGASLIYACIVKSLDVLFTPKMFPVLLGISIGVGYSGGLVGTLPFAKLVDYFGWREVLLIVAVLTLLAFILAMLMLTRTKRLGSRNIKIQGAGAMGAVLKNRSSYPVIFIGAINFSVYYIYQSTLGKKLLHDIYHLDSTTASLFTCIMMIVTIICLVSSGLISRYIGDKRKPIVLFATASMIVGAFILVGSIRYQWSYLWVMMGYCLLGLTSLGSVMTGTLMKEINPPETVGTAIGISNGSCYLAMAVFTSVAGYIMDKYAKLAVTVDGAVVYPKETYLTIIGIGILMLFVSLYLSVKLKDPVSAAISPN